VQGQVSRLTHSGQRARAKAGYHCGSLAFGYVTVPADGKFHRTEVDPAKAKIVVRIFERFVAGASCREIAGELNIAAVPSPGSTWRRTKRRSEGWMGSGIRVMLRNPRYTGTVIWNQYEWRKSPDDNLRKRVLRPREEWVERTDESLRIISDELWQRAQQRIARTAEDGNWARRKGKPRYLLSGLLRCATCGSHYIIANRLEYQCSTYRDGGGCTNGIRVRRESLEESILGPVRRELLAPERVARMAQEMADYYRERLRGMQERAAEAPKEIQDISARIIRLRERLKHGDPDMAPDEIQAAIDRAEEKRRELEAQQPEARAGAKVLSMLPKAAELFRRQVELGLRGDERSASKARVVLRELLGRINLKPEGEGELWAEYGVQPAAVLRVVGYSGSGGVLCTAPDVPKSARVK
jgi:hypothetical protein